MDSKDWDKYSKNYHDFIVSPFMKGAKNPLKDRIKEIKNTKNMVVADIGCGRGEIFSFLSDRFKQVYAFDFSKGMIEHAKKNNCCKNVKYDVLDMRKMKFKNKFDVVIAVNSVIMPKISDVKKSIGNIYSSLTKNGYFFGIFPAMETVLYQALLIHEKQLLKNNPESAMVLTKRKLENSKYNFIDATYDDGEKQKFYYSFELELRLKDAGFKDINISKVLYPWGHTDYEDFPDRPEIWDWFVSCRK